MDNTNYSLPPYGLLDSNFTDQLKLKPEVPPHFAAGENCDSQCRKKEWREWKRRTIELIAAELWPTFNEEKQQWEGASANSIVELTDNDLDLLIRIRTQSGGSPLTGKPASPVLAPDCPTHFEFFRAEDNSVQWFNNYHFYDRTIDPKHIRSFGDTLVTSVPAKLGTTHLQFKVPFQRPRPYQTALIRQKTKFTYRSANTAGTPSLCSGHGLQGLIGVGAIMESLILNDIRLSEDSWRALQQFAVDIGDRRVFAGVHYPGDNLSSWIIAMSLANKVFRTTEVQQRLWAAITQSAIYKLIVDSSLYQGPLKALESVSN